MKKVILSITAVSFLLFSCTSGSASSLENSADSPTAVETKTTNGSGETIKLTKQDFIEKNKKRIDV